MHARYDAIGDAHREKRRLAMRSVVIQDNRRPDLLVAGVFPHDQLQRALYPQGSGGIGGCSEKGDAKPRNRFVPVCVWPSRFGVAAGVLLIVHTQHFLRGLSQTIELLAQERGLCDEVVVGRLLDAVKLEFEAHASHDTAGRGGEHTRYA